MKLEWMDYVAIVLTIVALIIGLWLCLHTMQESLINCTVEHPCNITCGLADRLRTL